MESAETDSVCSGPQYPDFSARLWLMSSETEKDEGDGVYDLKSPLHPSQNYSSIQS